MCGRARLPNDYSEIRIELRFDGAFPAPNFKPSWNIAPTQPILTAARDRETGRRRPILMRWGLIPWWAKDEKSGASTFNARADTIDKKPAFRDAWRDGKRCLVVTDGFYEWNKRQGGKQPYAIARAAGKLTVMAGLWDQWTSPAKERMSSCTIITTEPNELLEPLHDRMPAILSEEDWAAWLGEVEATPDELKGLLRPFPAGEMRLWPVGREVGNWRNDGPGLVEPLATLL